MIIKRRIIDEKWFENNVNILDYFKLVQYKQCSNTDNYLIKIADFSTIHINLEQDENLIFKEFSKGTKYEIKRALKESVNFSIFKKENNITNYLNYYNEFAKAKHLNLITLNELNYYWDNLTITHVKDNQGNILSIHSYLADKKLKRVRLFHSISLFRIINNIDKNFIGRANRFLHWQDIIYFKNNNYKLYDMGGVALNNNDTSTIGIDKFKLGFSQNIIKEYNLVSPLLFLLMKLKKF